MKAHFNRFKSLFKRAHSKNKVKDPSDSRADSRADSFSPSAPYQLPPLREWPPPSPLLEQPQRPIGTPTSITSYKPLPELSSYTLPPIEEALVPFANYDPISISHSRGPLPDVAEEDPVDTTLLPSGCLAEAWPHNVSPPVPALVKTRSRRMSY